MNLPQFHLHAEIEQRHWWFRGRRRIMESLVRRVLSPSREESVVDIGCGTGGNISALSDSYSCIGIDRSPEAIRLAQGRFPNIRFIRWSGTGDQDSVHQAKLFLLMDVLEHLEDDTLFLSEWVAAARPGAHFLITVPADPRLWSPHDVSFGHYRRYDRKRLEQVWEGLPVTPLLVSYYNSTLYPAVRLARILSRGRGRTTGVAGTDFFMPPAAINALLEWIFSGEAKVLVDLLEGKRSRGFRKGVSLIALLHREKDGC
ncbi:MAG: methyltransferase domain-containing protein [Candidatus Omnitrophica bacterium]|nr:methyltransferase domain-containing protein [Candidatus Omnitrophota bacterium]